MKLIILVLAAALFATPAFGQGAPPPIGFWISPTSGARLQVLADGNCSFFGSVQVAGRCTWQASSRGGILTLIYPMPVEPGKIYYNVVWVDQNTITVFGEYFRKQ